MVQEGKKKKSKVAASRNIARFGLDGCVNKKQHSLNSNFNRSSTQETTANSAIYRTHKKGQQEKSLTPIQEQIRNKNNKTESCDKNRATPQPSTTLPIQSPHTYYSAKL